MELSGNKNKCVHPVISGLFFTLLFVLAAMIRPVMAGIPEGVAWLVTQQNTDGSYANATDVSSSFQATAETLHTFNFLGETAQAGIADAHAFLNAETYRNSENLARLIIAGAQVGDDVTAVIAELLAQQNLDGGFGELLGHDSTVVDTSMALQALAVAQHPLEQATTNAVFFLLNRQHADGGWSGGINTTSIYLSALAMRALWHYRTDFGGLNSALAGAKNFLLSNQITSGLWQTTFESALALIALIDNASEFSEVETLINELSSHQLSNGSWDDSPYATALAIRAITSRPTPVPPPVTTGEVTGRIFNVLTNQAIAGAIATIEGLAVVANSDESGRFTFTQLNAGDFTIHLAAPGYIERVATSSLAVGTVVSLGDIRLSPLPTTAVLQGQVNDVQTGLPIAGAAIELSGGNLVSVTTGVNGSYNLANLAPGDVSIAVAKTGYLTAATSVSLVAGNAIVFNPALTPVNVKQETSPTPTTDGTLQGQVIDQSSRLPITGATILVSGNSSNSVVTAADGSYNIPGLAPGEIAIVVSMPGYLSATATATITANIILTFDIQLVLESTVDPMVGTLLGQVVDMASQDPLSGAIVTIDNSTSNKIAATGQSGSFKLTNVPADTYNVTVALDGYNSTTFNAVVAAGGTVDLQTIALEKVISDVTVFGSVTDIDSGAPVNNATITILGTAFNSATDLDGKYLMSGLDVGIKTLVFSATGYANKILTFDFPNGGVYQLDRPLSLSQFSILNLTSFGTDQLSYPAYANIQLQATVLNSADTLIDATVEYSIMNDQDQVVARLKSVWTDVNGVEQSIFAFNPGISVELTAAWNTGINIPGSYRVIARVVVGNSVVGPANIIFAERVSSFTIEATEAIAQLNVKPLPAFSGVGRNEQITLEASIVNRSNVATSFALSYRLELPDGELVHANIQTIPLLPEEDNKVIDLETFTTEFTTQGVHPVLLQVTTGTLPDTLTSAEIMVAPGVRIQAAQNITPANVTPDGDKRIRINIRLEGMEIK